MKPRGRSTDTPFRHITIVGVGLIGGSLGLAIKQRVPRAHVIGCDSKDVLKRALRRKAIDEAQPHLDAAVRHADLILLATPISSILKLLPPVSRSIKSGALVSDVGSVKSAIVREAHHYFRDGNFIGGHPMAGVELSGVEAAHPLLFENAIYVLTPARWTNARSLSQLGSFLQQLGARVVKLDADVHDEVAAAVSHLPQLTAVALMNAVGNRHPSARRHLQLAAGGFRDLTRIASSRFDIWKDILSLNEKEIRRALALLVNELNNSARSLKRKQISQLARRFHSARKLRQSIPTNMKGFLHPLAELYVFVEDRPGMLARMTKALAKGKINIKDIELMKIREGTGGTFRLSFDTKEVSRKAALLLRRVGFAVEELS